MVLSFNISISLIIPISGKYVKDFNFTMDDNYVSKINIKFILIKLYIKYCERSDVYWLLANKNCTFVVIEKFL